MSGRPSSDVTFASVCWGDKYSPDYVGRLAGAIARNTGSVFPFVCVTDRPALVARETGLDVLAAAEGLPGWWQKLALFDRARMGCRYVVHVDLDVVILKPLTAVLSRVGAHDLLHAQDLVDPLSSSLMVIDTESELARAVLDGFRPEEWSLSMRRDRDSGFGPQGCEPVSGDQKYLARFVGEAGFDVAALGASEHCSYKYLVDHGDWRRRATNSAFTGCTLADVTSLNFHGFPKPHDLAAEPGRWPHAASILPHWK